MNDIISAVDLTRYAVGILLDAGLSGRLIYLKNGHYILSETGYFLLHNRMTRVNMAFTQDVCFLGMFYFDKALSEKKSAGLRVFGDWPTIYPALGVLPLKARKGWSDFDHFIQMRHFRLHCPT